MVLAIIFLVRADHRDTRDVVKVLVMYNVQPRIVAHADGPVFQVHQVLMLFTDTCAVALPFLPFGGW